MEQNICVGVVPSGEMIADKVPQYYYFCLKNGARKTSFRTNKEEVTGETLDDYIKNLLSVYPEGAEIYPITKDEHETIRAYNKTITHIFNRARKRSTTITNINVIEEMIEPIATAINNLLG